MDTENSILTLGAQLTAWRECVRRQSVAQLAADLSLSEDLLQKMEAGDQNVPIAAWFAVWRAMGIEQDVLDTTVPGEAIVREVAEAAMESADG